MEEESISIIQIFMNILTFGKQILKFTTIFAVYGILLRINTSNQRIKSSRMKEEKFEEAARIESAEMLSTIALKRQTVLKQIGRQRSTGVRNLDIWPIRFQTPPNLELTKNTPFAKRNFKEDPMIIGLSPMLKPRHFERTAQNLRKKTKFFELSRQSLEEQNKDSFEVPELENLEEIPNTSTMNILDPESVDLSLPMSASSYGKKKRCQRAINNWKKMVEKLLELNKVMRLDEYHETATKTNGISEPTKSEKAKRSTCCIILPESLFKIAWSGIMVICLIFTAIYVPIRLAFLDEISIQLMAVEYSFDAFFVGDIFVNFYSAFFDANHNLITNKKIIAKAYIKSWFFVDLIACLPFSLLELTYSSENKQQNYNKLFRLLRIGRLYRIIKVFNFLRVLKFIKNSKTYEKLLIALKMNAGIKRLIKTILTFFLVAHFFGCIWFYQAKFVDFEPDTWVVRYGVLDLPPGSQYLFSFYWVMTLATIGYGDIIPYTKTERFLSLIYIFVGVAFVSYSISSLSSIMLSSDSKKQKLKEKILVLDELALAVKMKSDLYYRIKTIIRNNHETNFYSDMSHESLLEELPSGLRSQLITLIYQQNNLGVIAFFDGKNPEFLHAILPLLKRITLEKDEVIYRDGDWADESNAQLISPDNYIFRNYIQGSYFGETEILRKIDFRKESAIAAEDCELLTLKKDELRRILDKYDSVQLQMFYIMNQREMRNQKSLEKARNLDVRLEEALRERITKGRKSLYNIDYFNKETNTHIRTAEDLRASVEKFRETLAEKKLSPGAKISESDSSSSSSSESSSRSSQCAVFAPQKKYIKSERVSESESESSKVSKSSKVPSSSKSNRINRKSSRSCKEIELMVPECFPGGRSTRSRRKLSEVAPENVELASMNNPIPYPTPEDSENSEHSDTNIGSERSKEKPQVPPYLFSPNTRKPQNPRTSIHRQHTLNRQAKRASDVALLRMDSPPSVIRSKGRRLSATPESPTLVYQKLVQKGKHKKKSKKKYANDDVGVGGGNINIGNISQRPRGISGDTGENIYIYDSNVYNSRRTSKISQKPKKIEKELRLLGATQLKSNLKLLKELRSEIHQLKNVRHKNNISELTNPMLNVPIGGIVGSLSNRGGNKANVLHSLDWHDQLRKQKYK